VRHEDFTHLLAAMIAISDQPVCCRIDDKIEHEERYPAHRHWGVVGNPGDLDCTVTPLDSESDGIVNLDCDRSVGCSSDPLSAQPETELLDQLHRQAQTGGVRGDKCFCDYHCTDGVWRKGPIARCKQVGQVLDFRGDSCSTHDLYSNASVLEAAAKTFKSTPKGWDH
jgi:hypothetical protein